MKRQKTQKKYIAFLKHLEGMGDFILALEVQNKRIDNSLPGILEDLGCITAPNGFTEICSWTSKEKIDQNLLEKIITRKVEKFPNTFKKKVKKQTELFSNDITEEQAIQVLKASSKFKYEIYRVTIEKQKL